jgi:membrane-associated HD superfamily phosphohydrolase
MRRKEDKRHYEFIKLNPITNSQVERLDRMEKLQTHSSPHHLCMLKCEEIISFIYLFILLSSTRWKISQRKKSNNLLNVRVFGQVLIFVFNYLFILCVY